MSSYNEVMDFKDFLDESYGKSVDVKLSVNAVSAKVMGNFPITISVDYDNCNVNIMWEDGGYANYSRYGLYGLYGTKWLDMEFDEVNKKLLIIDSNKNVIEIQA